MKSNNRHNLCILIIIIGIFLFVPNAIFAQEWQFVKSGKEFGISGMALIEQNDDHLSFLVNHDSKKENDIRLAIVTIDTNNKIQYIPLNWPEGIDLPEDLEALTAIPHGNGTSFMTLVSNGRIYHIKLNISEGSITVLKVFTLPGVSGRSNFEGFALKEIGDKLLAVWADRGKNSCPAIIYWGLFNLRTYEFSDLNSTPLKVPWPKKSEVRHVSDLKIDTHGNLFVSSTSDPGDDGSFQSAVYMVGLFCINSGNVLFRKNTTLKEIYHFEGHKVEALEILPGGLSNIVLATDDENMGASIFLDISRTYVQEEIRLLEEIVRLDEVIAERLRFEFVDFQPKWRRVTTQKFLLVDQLGEKWLFKIMSKSMIKHALIAHYLNLLCQYELPATYAVNLTINERQYEGLLIQWVDGVPLDSEKPFKNISEEEQQCIAGQLVIDWWIGNIDEKPEHVLRSKKDKRLFFIDKDNAFSTQKLSLNDLVKRCSSPRNFLFRCYTDFISECDPKTVIKHRQQVEDIIHKIFFLEQELLQKIRGKDFTTDNQAVKFLFERRNSIEEDFRSMFDEFALDCFEDLEYRNSNWEIHKQLVFYLRKVLTKRQQFIKTLKRFKNVEQKSLEIIASPEGWYFIRHIIVGNREPMKVIAKDNLLKLKKFLDTQEHSLIRQAIKRYIGQVEQFLEEDDLSVFYIISETVN